MNIDPELLKLLACPACRGELDTPPDELACRKCGRRYPVRDGIPDLVVEAGGSAPLT